MQAPYITSRIYKNYDNDVFRFEIQSFCFLKERDLGLFKESIFGIFKNHAPIKKNLCASEVPFITNELHSAVTKRPKYRYKFFKNENQTNKKNYKVQKNFWEKLFQKTKKSYFDSLNTKKSQIVELSGKLLLVFSEKQLQKVKKCFLMKQKNIVLMIKKKKMQNL